jgi:phosphate transport system protein
MELHLDKELAQLKETLLRMSAQAEQTVAQTLKALQERNDALANQVVAADDLLDKLQVEIDNECIRLLALRQPTARDLRLIVMTMRIVTELERIGDQCVNIAQEAAALNQEPPLKPLLDISRMADHAQGMIRDALDAFVFAKPDLSREVIARDDRVDQLNRQLHRELTSFMIEDPHTITRALHLMVISQNIERIADHATNIAEEVIYLYEARDIRHQHP